MQRDTNKRTWFEFKEDDTIMCKHGCLDGNVNKKRITHDILCWKHHGKSNQQWKRIFCERPPIGGLTNLQ